MGAVGEYDRGHKQSSPGKELSNEAKRGKPMREKMTETWSVHGQVPISPRSVSQAQFTENLVRIAAACSAEYDGWGTSL